jgi:hypothetical protein
MADATTTAYGTFPETIHRLWRDLGHGLRALRHSPTFTIVAIVSLALGVGANTAIFQLLDAVRLRTLPVKSPQDLVELRIDDMTHARGNWLRDNALTNPLWEEIRRRQQVFSDVFAWADESFNISPSREYRFARGLWVSGNLFDALGVRPILGRVFTANDDRRGCGPAGAVISYGFWQLSFGGSASVIGRKIKLDNASVEVIGLILGETGLLLAVGIGGGVLLSLITGRVAASLLFGLRPSDPLTLAAAGIALAAVALGASAVPAQQACAVDAATALRQD